MKILKTSALAAVLALGSLTANAAYSGSDTFDIQINTTAAITVAFADAKVQFDDVIPGDTVDGEIALVITGSSTNAMSCTLQSGSGTAAAIGGATKPVLNIDFDPNNTVVGDEIILTSLTYTLDACSKDGVKLEIDGQINNAAPVGITSDTTMTLAVSYGVNATIAGVNS
jgi:hypothetical protein